MRSRCRTHSEQYNNVVTRVVTAIEMRAVAEPFIAECRASPEKGTCGAFGAGTGNPHFSTDTAAALQRDGDSRRRHPSMTKVDGIYTADPDVHMMRYDRISYLQVLEQGLKVMDVTAISCMG